VIEKDVLVRPNALVPSNVENSRHAYSPQFSIGPLLFGVFTIAFVLASATAELSALSLDFSSSSVSFWNIPIGSTQKQYKTLYKQLPCVYLSRFSRASVSGSGFSLSD